MSPRSPFTCSVLTLSSHTDAYFALPVMLVVLVARWVAGLFVGGVFTNYNR
jgi:hypothetical protein